MEGLPTPGSLARKGKAKSEALGRPKGAPLISVGEAEAAANALGLNLITRKHLDASGQLGQYIEQVGGVAVSRAMLLITSEQALLGAERALALEEESPDIESKGAALKVHQGYLSLVQNAAKGIAEAVKTVVPSGEGEGQKKTPPPPGAVVVIHGGQSPVQVHPTPA